MADSHLLEMHTVETAFYAEIGISAAQPVPNGFYVCGNIRCRPIGISVVRNHAAQPLKLVVFILDGSFKPIVAVEIDRYAALVETPFAVKLRLYGEREKILACLQP